MRETYHELHRSLTNFLLGSMKDFDSIYAAIRAYTKRDELSQLSSEDLSQIKQFIVYETEGVEPERLKNIILSINLYERAMKIDDYYIRQQLLASAIRAWPENSDAIVQSRQYSENEKRKILEELIASKDEEWQSGNEKDSSFFEVRQYIRMHVYLASICLRLGHYYEAAQILQKIEKYDEYQITGAPFLKASCSLYAGDFAEVDHFLKNFKRETTFYYLLQTLRYVLSDQKDHALPSFLKLYEVNPYIKHVFQQGEIRADKVRNFNRYYGIENRTLKVFSLFLPIFAYDVRVKDFFKEAIAIYEEAYEDESSWQGEQGDSQEKIIKFPNTH